MGIDKIDGFNTNAPKPIDSRFQKASIAARNAIPSAFRYEGLTCYVIAEGKEYTLVGGIDDSNWIVTGSATSLLIDANRPIAMIPEGTNLGNSSMAINEFLEAVFFYDPPIINSFTGGANLEKGETNLSKTLSYNVEEPDGTYVISSIIITSNQGHLSGDIKVGTGDQIGTHLVTLTTDTNETFTLTVASTQTGISVTSTTSFGFYNRVYWGVDTVPGGGYDDAFIKGLANDALASSYTRTFTVNAGAGEYIYYAVPKTFVTNPYLNPPYFFVGGFAGGFEIADNTVSYTYGTNTEDYVVYKSVNANLGSTSVSIQTSS